MAKLSGLDEVRRLTAGLNFGATDCVLPMLHALDEGIEVDVFVVYTDSETGCGGTHPAQALAEYWRATGIRVKRGVTAMAGNGFSIADPHNAGMPDEVGFDASVPRILAEFAD